LPRDALAAERAYTRIYYKKTGRVGGAARALINFITARPGADARTRRCVAKFFCKHAANDLSALRGELKRNLEPNLWSVWRQKKRGMNKSA
jgi:hypothetical protein